MLDDVETFPDHGDDGPRSHVVDETGEEGLRLQVLVVLLQMSTRGGKLLEGDEFVAAALEARDDLPDEAALYAVRLHCDERAFSRRHLHCRKRHNS